MGVSTDGIIAFGIVLEEGQGLPWEADPDFEEWWRRLNGWTEEWSAADKTFYDRRRVFDNTHHPPVVPVNVCSDDCPIWLLAVPSSHRECSRGYPASFDPSALKVMEDEQSRLREFVSRWFPDYAGEPKWFLGSYCT